MITDARIRLHEYERRTPEDCPDLAGLSFDGQPAARSMAKDLTDRGLLEIVELRNGLGITASSWVGQISLGNTEITIRPKLNEMRLLPLLRYAYDLRDLELFPTSQHTAGLGGFQDLLIYQLIAEARELISRGVHQRYVRREESLAVLRGRINIQWLSKKPSLADVRLPCRYHPRQDDVLINQILLAGLRLASRLASVVALRSEARRTAQLLEESVSAIDLNASVMRQLHREADRQTVAYRPCIQLIELLLASHAVLLDHDEKRLAVPGFLFDMTRFFQALLFKFLSDSLSGLTVLEEVGLRGMLAYSSDFNPLNRRSPSLRPDFAILDGRRTVALLDAKYRDIWERGLPRDMLYQLGMYAMSRGLGGLATILYPTLANEATEERIQIREAVAGAVQAEVGRRPVKLQLLERLIEMPKTPGAARLCEKYAKWLVLGGPEPTFEQSAPKSLQVA